MANARKSVNYINGKDFYDAMLEYKTKCKECENVGKPKPKIPDYIGRCFMQIADRLSSRPNFVNYPFKEDMIGDAYENCVKYIHNFDESKSKNPFAYFTQITWYAFLRRIDKEKKMLYIKHKVNDHNIVVLDLAGESVNIDITENASDFVKTFESKMNEKRK